MQANYFTIRMSYIKMMPKNFSRYWKNFIGNILSDTFKKTTRGRNIRWKFLEQSARLCKLSAESVDNTNTFDEFKEYADVERPEAGKEITEKEQAGKWFRIV